jgi:hypothetical protein
VCVGAGTAALAPCPLVLRKLVLVNSEISKDPDYTGQRALNACHNARACCCNTEWFLCATWDLFLAAVTTEVQTHHIRVAAFVFQWSRWKPKLRMLIVFTGSSLVTGSLIDKYASQKKAYCVWKSYPRGPASGPFSLADYRLRPGSLSVMFGSLARAS